MRGFTLLEVLVAIAILSLIGLGALSMMDTMKRSKTGTDVSRERFTRLMRTLQHIESDLSQLTARHVRDSFGDPLDPLMVATGSYPLELTKTGWRNPAAVNRSSLQRVAYELTAEGELNRYFWLVLDRAEDSEPVIQTLSEDVVDFRVNVLDSNNNSTTSWPAGLSSGFDQGSDQGAGLPPLLPVAVEINLDIEGVGEIRKVVKLVSNPVAGTAAAGSGSE